MKLESITARVRPRMGWEAVDLGFRMVHRYWRELYTIWFGLTLPPLLLSLIILPEHALFILFIFWWLRPLFESALLNYASKALFGEYPSLSDSFKTFHKYAFKQFIQNLIWRRLSPTRSMDMAVSQLENLSGLRRQKRINTLHAFNSGAASWLTLLFLFLHLLFYLNLILVGLWLIPDVYLLDIENWVAEIFWSTNSVILQVIQVGIMYLLISFFSPFYILGGFSIYINQRTILEAWDIELIFKHLRQRTEQKNEVSSRRKVASGTAMLLCCWMAISPQESIAKEPLDAQQDFDHVTAKQAIKKIVSEKPFKQQVKKDRIVYDLGFDDSDNDENSSRKPYGVSSPFFNLLSHILEFFLWALVIGMILFLALRITKVKSFFQTPKARRKRTPDALFGLDLIPESLPENPSEQSWQLWQQGKFREALSLLVRATLAELINNHNCHFEDGFTELECSRVVKVTAYSRVASYFEDLTHHWRLLAYGHKMPPTSTMRSLCELWPKIFAENPVEQPNDRA